MKLGEAGASLSHTQGKQMDFHGKGDVGILPGEVNRWISKAKEMLTRVRTSKTLAF
jgi:hypothetical protein